MAGLAAGRRPLSSSVVFVTPPVSTRPRPATPACDATRIFWHAQHGWLVVAARRAALAWSPTPGPDSTGQARPSVPAGARVVVVVVMRRGRGPGPAWPVAPVLNSQQSTLVAAYLYLLACAWSGRAPRSLAVAGSQPAQRRRTCGDVGGHGRRRRPAGKVTFPRVVDRVSSVPNTKRRAHDDC